MRFLFIILIFSISFSQVQEYVLKDGTKLKGTVLSESETDLVIQTNYGAVTIKKSDILLKEFTVKMLSGDVFNGTKQIETETELHLKTNIGLLKLTKDNIASIDEVGKNLNYGISNNYNSKKEKNFSIGEEQLIDLFFDPTAYTLPQSTFYISGLSFGFGITDKLQVTTKWINYLWGDFNLRVKNQIFLTGNWEKQQALSLGAHYHTQWKPSSFIRESENYDEDMYYRDTHMIEVFGAFTSSNAREGLKGRTSHTFGGNFKHAFYDIPLNFYRIYYGLDVDITSNVKMVSEVFYDPNYTEFWKMMNYDESTENNPIHFDFGFIYAINESFRFGLHFQQPWLAFYWKI